MSFNIQSYGLSDVGLLRQNNEDVWEELIQEQFYIVADGMGGHKAGEVASRKAVQSICSAFKALCKSHQRGEQDVSMVKAFMKQIVCDANARIYKMGREYSQLKGMGTTVCCLCFREGQAIYAHVGDSRIYRFRQHRLKQLTQDHSLFMDLLAAGKVEQEEALDFHGKNVITKAVGVSSSLEPSISSSPAQVDDIYLICTDGLSDFVSHQDLEASVASMTSLKNLSRVLLETAKRKGGQDNITLIVIKLEGLSQ